MPRGGFPPADFFFADKAYLTHLDFMSNSSGGLVGKVGKEGGLGKGTVFDMFSAAFFSAMRVSTQGFVSLYFVKDFLKKSGDQTKTLHFREENI